jgi:hypothetical protein
MGARQYRGGSSGGRAVAFVVVRHGSAFARLQRQAGLGSVEGLDLALLVDSNDDGVSRRGHVETDDVFDLGGEGGVARSLEDSQTVGLETMGFPDALDGSERDAEGFGHCAAGPMGHRTGRFGAGLCDDPSDNGRSDRRRTGFARLVAKKTIDAFLSEALLHRQTAGRLTPARRGTSSAGKRSPESSTILGRQHMLERAVAVTDDLFKPSTIGGVQEDIDGLGHDGEIACPRQFVNLLSASLH